jgi:hypothetical protein
MLICKYYDVRTIIHRYGRNYIRALSVLNYRLDELSDILNAKVDVVKKAVAYDLKDNYK